MAHFLFVLVTLALLAGFLALTQYESRKGVRFLADRRARFDADVERVEFILAHIDFAAFLKEEVRHAAHQVSHTAAHLSLQAVRTVERSLTRIVRSLRSRQEEITAPRENAREFVKTLSDFKGTLNATHPEISDIQGESQE